MANTDNFKPSKDSISKLLEVQLFNHPVLPVSCDVTGQFYIFNSQNKLKRITRGIEDSKGYLVINIKEKKHKAHRLAFECYSGFVLDNELCRLCRTSVDHINRDKKGNSKDNLRLVTCAVNSRNRKGSLGLPYNIVRIKNKSGDYSYRAKVYVDRQTTIQGTSYKDISLAIAERDTIMSIYELTLPIGAQ